MKITVPARVGDWHSVMIVGCASFRIASDVDNHFESILHCTVSNVSVDKVPPKVQ